MHTCQINAIPIVNAVGYIAGLLDLRHHDAGTKGMDTTCGDIKYITLMDDFMIEHRLYGIVFQYTNILHAVHLTIETSHQFCTLIGLHHIPHLSFTVALLTFLSQFIVRMHLNRQPVVGIDNLNQQRKLFSVFVKHTLANQITHEGLHQVIYLVAFEVAVGNHALLFPKTRKQPHLTTIGHRAVIHTKLFLDFSAAPNLILEDGLEFQWVKYSWHFSFSILGQR